MIFRTAKTEDIGQIQVVRHSVKENTLSDPSLVPDSDVEDYILNRGKGWVCVTEGKIVAFAIVSIQDANVWALFVEPGYDGRGIGRRLHGDMMDWYFGQTDTPIWLGTAPQTRAEKFYRTAGWREAGLHGKNEIRFEMTAEEWKRLKTHNS